MVVLGVQPTGENGATRAPIVVDLQRDPGLSSKSIVLQIDSKSQQVSASQWDLTNFALLDSVDVLAPVGFRDGYGAEFVMSAVLRFAAAFAAGQAQQGGVQRIQ